MNWGNCVSVLRSYKRTIAFLMSLLGVQLVFGLIAIYVISLSITNGLINTVINQAKQDISYSSLGWDTTKYDTDPDIPGAYRIYVITKDGFIIDRWRPISGYLDTSDFKQLMTFTKPQPAHTVTGQDWRMFSLPIQDSTGNTVGVIAVGHLSVSDDKIYRIDQDLQMSAKTLLGKVKVVGNNIDTSAINVRDAPIDVSFQIVDQFNKIHIKSDNASSIDRLPNYIDPSYLSSLLAQPSKGIIKDAKTHESFLYHSSPINSNGIAVGTIIVARTVSPYYQLLRTYAFWSIAFIILITCLAVVALYKKTSSGLESSKKSSKKITFGKLESIEFFKKDSCLVINQTIKVEFTYATNQYYLCLAVFGSPKKRWETDELIEKFGSQHNQDSWRKVYDAMNSINKKTYEYLETKLIVTNNKTYQLNPEVVKVARINTSKS